MAFGFGFNKAKVLASAEKCVQQGKLHNAITEYEKIVEKDPKDLTVLNTIGDLYARLGQSEKAGDFFKRVGDTYAADGFTVKAIAMYKKLTKLNLSNTTVVQRLAELYTQQGLYNDARQQYLQLADGYIKNNDLTGATKIFQKMLEIDPDNVSLQTKLADLYVKMGEKDQARDIFLRAATSLYERGSAEQADQALDRMLALDPTNADALLMRGKLAMDAGDGASAVRYLEKVPNLDSKADGLQALLKAEILTNSVEGAGAVARKLATVHHDLTGIRTYADYLLAANRAEDALSVYDEFADQLLVGDTGELVFALQGLTGQLKDNPASLEKLLNVFRKAGATGNIPEVNELLAHAYVQAGELAKARDLYKELADLEPSNPVHMQNYRQVLARLGEEPMSRPLSAAESSQAFFVEEIEAPPLDQEYTGGLKDEIDTVLSEAELFESYNKSGQAVAPLERVLAKAPTDARINQRLVSVYQKLGRMADAARCCDVLRDVYESFGKEIQSKQYAEMAAKFREQAGTPATQVKAMPAVPEMPVASVQEITPDALGFAAGASAAEMPAIPADSGEAHEIDLSAEWEIAVEPPEAAAAEQTPTAGEFAVAPATQFEVAPGPTEFEVAPTPEGQPSVVADLLEEIRFYLSQQMWDEARSAVSRCEQTSADAPGLAELKQELEAATAKAPAKEAVEVDVEAEVPAHAEDATVSEFDFETATASALEPTFEVSLPEAVAEMPVQSVEAIAETEAALPRPEVPGEFEVASEPTLDEAAFAETVEEVAPVAQVEAPVAEPEPVAQAPIAEPAIEEPIAAEAVTAPAVSEPKDVLSDMVLDLESALGEDFGVPAAKPVEAPTPVVAAAAAAAARLGAPVASAASAATPSIPIPPPQPVMSQADTSSVLSDLFEEFKQEVGEPAEETEDPETHYNLGVAFKEMGLLDEAIGELQKVCKAIDQGVPFSQVMQAYTWLANCFVEKGVPEAAIKWYEKALNIPSSEDSQTALHYDLASAYEAAGDKHAALKHFTEVYGTNIDYRDVAERIKALKS
ncbi:MAG: tetratricopeptide repeat protein [Terriglobales bacterium]